MVYGGEQYWVALVFELRADPLSLKYHAVSRNIASTEFNEDLGEYLKGVVHDENAQLLGGVAGFAGVFHPCFILLYGGSSWYTER